MEDIILLETAMARPNEQVFVLQFAVGEFDMVTFLPEAASCKVYEIKHSKEAVPQQYRHLMDSEKLHETEKQYGTIESRFVIYNGECGQEGPIHYLNVEEYLLGLQREANTA